MKNHIISVDDIERDEVFKLFDDAVKFSSIKDFRYNVLHNERIANLFYEPSTRTRVSFEIASRSLGAEVINISADESSIKKGETLNDTLETLESLGVNLAVVRYNNYLPEIGSFFDDPRPLPKDIKIINAGDGLHEHPTQALLDAFTIKEHFGHVANLNIVILGDCLNSRVANSNAKLLHKLGARVTFCYGSEPHSYPVAFHVRPQLPVVISSNIPSCLQFADVIMVLRTQSERGGVQGVYVLDRHTFEFAPRHAVVMHPGPIGGSEVSREIADGPRSLIRKQVENGLYIRKALLVRMLYNV